MIQVRHAMNHKPCTLDSEASVAEAAKKLIETGEDLLIITRGNDIIGTVDHEKVLKYTYITGLSPRQIPVGEIANPDIVMVRPDTSIEDVLTIMTEMKQGTLPVVDGGLIGSISIYDVLKVSPKTRPLKKAQYMG